jgi:hypothetical protein
MAEAATAIGNRSGLIMRSLGKASVDQRAGDAAPNAARAALACTATARRVREITSRATRYVRASSRPPSSQRTTTEGTRIAPPDTTLDDNRRAGR